jgi:anaerobic carbon-monoxide dehydrogenase catalytic subunit
MGNFRDNTTSISKQQHNQVVSLDRDFEILYEKACDEGIETAFSRAKQTTAVCPFGSAGVCCRHCLEGPCRVAVNGKGAQRGICGADADTIVARNLLTSIIEGAANHIEHGREIALALLEAAEGRSNYEIKGTAKLYQIAVALGIVTDGKTVEAIAKEVAYKALEDFQQQTGIPNWLKLHAQEQSIKRWEELGIIPVNAHLEVAKAVSRTAMGWRHRGDGSFDAKINMLENMLKGRQTRMESHFNNLPSLFQCIRRTALHLK